MTETKKSEEIGLGQAYRLCNMPSDKRIKFIAQGLPIILESARSLIRASRALNDQPRETEILERHAEEECAKLLILIDVVRCPPKIVSHRLGYMMKWFYDHLARRLYAEAQTWKPVTVNMLQEYVDGSRQSHCLEGEYSEYIMPNWALFGRESALYADVMCDEEGEPEWCAPTRTPTVDFGVLEPASYLIAEALDAVGAFSESGLKIVRDVWGKVDFKGDQAWSPACEMAFEMAKQLERAGLITDRFTQAHMRTLLNMWQIPMYHIDFSTIQVTLEKLRARREAEFNFQFGDSDYGESDYGSYE